MIRFVLQLRQQLCNKSRKLPQYWRNKCNKCFFQGPSEHLCQIAIIEGRINALIVRPQTWTKLQEMLIFFSLRTNNLSWHINEQFCIYPIIVHDWVVLGTGNGCYGDMKLILVRFNTFTALATGGIMSKL